MTHADSTHAYFTYDSQGRLSNTQGDNQTGSATYAYLRRRIHDDRRCHARDHDSAVQ